MGQEGLGPALFCPSVVHSDLGQGTSPLGASRHPTVCGRRQTVWLPDLLYAAWLTAASYSPFLMLLLFLNRYVMSHSFATLWTVAHQARLSMGFPRQESWSGLPFPPPWYLPNTELKPTSPAGPTLADRFFTTLLLKGDMGDS